MRVLTWTKIFVLTAYVALSLFIVFGLPSQTLFVHPPSLGGTSFPFWLAAMSLYLVGAVQLAFRKFSAFFSLLAGWLIEIGVWVSSTNIETVAETLDIHTLALFVILPALVAGVWVLRVAGELSQ
jgi:hypothetical protein